MSDARKKQPQNVELIERRRAGEMRARRNFYAGLTVKF